MSKLNLVEFKKFETLYEDEALTLYGQGSAGVGEEGSTHSDSSNHSDSSDYSDTSNYNDDSDYTDSSEFSDTSEHSDV